MTDNRDLSKDFSIIFQITKKIIFKVSYYHCGNNEHPYFTTSAAVFNQPKTDYTTCGQCQYDVLKHYLGPARSFWAKWDKHHLHRLTTRQYNQLLKDLKPLKAYYNFTELNPQSHNDFYACKVLSMQKVKGLVSLILKHNPQYKEIR